jgi:asparagine synthase (glutamine-hydrolysing)
LHFAPQDINDEEAEKKLLALLEESVRLHMISDVPVGFLLSGGIDSTAMLSLATKNSDRQLSSFTLGFSEPGLIDERPYATLAARTFGADHHEMTISSKEFADFLPKFAWYMEEPCCEPQAVALYYVSRLAKEFVKVLISGEGGDEAFAGYQTYRGVFWLERLKSAVGPLRGPLSATAHAIDRALPLHRLAKYGPLMNADFERYYYSRTATPFLYFNSCMSDFYSKDFLAHVDKDRSLSVVTRYLAQSNGNGKINRMLYVDTKTSLPDDLLLQADKMTMANSIELRVPLLDHVLLEFAATLPEHSKVRWFTTKYIMKSALRNRVPKEILYRKKAGFPVPYAAWLRGELKDWTMQILLDPATLSRGYFNPSSVERLIQQESQTGRYSKEILSLLSLELWHRAFLKNDNFSGETAEAFVSA